MEPEKPAEQIPLHEQLKQSATLKDLAMELVLARGVIAALREASTAWLDGGPIALGDAIDSYDEFLASGEQRIVPDSLLPIALQGRNTENAVRR